MCVQSLCDKLSVPQTFATCALQGLDSVIPVLVALSCLGTLNGGIFVSPRYSDLVKHDYCHLFCGFELILSCRMLFVGAREGYWPQIFSTIHIRRHTPLPALLLMVKSCPHIINQSSA